MIRAWVYTGVIFERCKQKRIGGLASAPRDSDDSKELAGETVSEAIVAFRKNVLIPGRWDPTRGASLKTFFVGQCLFQFPNVYRRWLRESQVLLPAPEVLARELAGARTIPAPQYVVADLVRAVGRLKQDSPEMIEGLAEMGFSGAEIAELLGTTARAVESKVYRHRRQRQL